MTDTQMPAQQGDTVKIEYQDKEGNKYNETHGDPDDNLTVETVAEQKGAVQPNLEGTTPHPHNPKLTAQEAERRGLTREGEPKEGQPDPPESRTTTTPEPHTGSGSGSKQAAKPADKSVSSPTGNK